VPPPPDKHHNAEGREERESERASERGRKDKDTQDREVGEEEEEGEDKGFVHSKEGIFLFSDVWLQRRRSVPLRGSVWLLFYFLYLVCSALFITILVLSGMFLLVFPQTRLPPTHTYHSFGLAGWVIQFDFLSVSSCMCVCCYCCCLAIHSCFEL